MNKIIKQRKWKNQIFFLPHGHKKWKSCSPNSVRKKMEHKHKSIKYSKSFEKQRCGKALVGHYVSPYTSGQQQQNKRLNYTICHNFWSESLDFEKFICYSWKKKYILFLHDRMKVLTRVVMFWLDLHDRKLNR